MDLASSLLWGGFDPWAGNCCMQRGQPKNKTNGHTKPKIAIQIIAAFPPKTFNVGVCARAHSEYYRGPQ